MIWGSAWHELENPERIMAMQSWYYGDAGQQHGPISLDNLKSKLAAGTLGPDTLVWREGLTDWKPALELAELQTDILLSAKSAPAAVSPYAPPTAAPLGEVDWNQHMPTGPQIRPWVRYWARTFDFLAFSVIAGGVAGLIDPELIEADDNVLGIAALFLYNLFEPLMLSIFGTTPFKALLRVKLRNQDGSKLSYGQGFIRIIRVWFSGQGLGIPIVLLITHIFAYNRLTNKGVTSWDESGRFKVTHQPVQWWRWLILLGLFWGFSTFIYFGAQA